MIDFLNEDILRSRRTPVVYQVLRVAVGVEALDVPGPPLVLAQVGSSDELRVRW